VDFELGRRETVEPITWLLRCEGKNTALRFAPLAGPVIVFDSNQLDRRHGMPKYLIQASYSAEGARGLLKHGGSKRKQAAEDLIKSVGGKVEGFYFAFGDNDAFVILDAPDNASVAAASLAVSASGLVSTKTTVLMTPEEVDQAAKKSVKYSPPGK
jgi:uncharacterized protein with GYD domain